MKQYDLSILIPARNEEFLSLTVDNILKNKTDRTEVIVGLDGAWANPPLDDHPDVTIVYYPESIGQRAITNKCARLSKAKYVMKVDAHAVFDYHFDEKMMNDMQDDWTMIPAMYNLHAFDWKCKKCGNKWYQSPTPTFCKDKYEGGSKNPKCDSKEFERVIIWERRKSRRSEYYRFDTDMHFQYHSKRKKEDAKNLIGETMSAQGSCFMLTRDKYWELDICDEKHGSWGQQGTEVACKTWLSGGRLVTNKKTWYAHMFRTQGGDFSFPYPQSGNQVEGARRYSKDMWLNNKWKLQERPLSWLIDKFEPLPSWHEEGGKKILEKVNKAGEEFGKNNNIQYKANYFDVNPRPTKGIIYYTDNQLNVKLSKAVQKNLKKVGLPIVSVSLKPMDLGKNIVLPLKRGYEAYFTQILTALENSDAEYIYFCEHDWFYHPSHFEGTGANKEAFYYNDNWWRVRASDGHAVKYDTHLLPALSGYRDTLLKYYRKQYNWLKERNFETKAVLKSGFEPATHKRVPELSGGVIESYKSDYPNLDIRHNNNLTASKWSVDAFRSPRNASGWVENDENIEGWGKLHNRFDEFIKEGGKF